MFFSLSILIKSSFYSVEEYIKAGLGHFIVNQDAKRVTPEKKVKSTLATLTRSLRTTKWHIYMPPNLINTMINLFFVEAVVLIHSIKSKLQDTFSVISAPEFDHTNYGLKSVFHSVLV